MSISTSLNAGVAGLAANSTKLATIADNIANSGTYGYKRSEADFNSMVINSARSAGTYSAGGVRASTSRTISESGPLVSTEKALDIAISGRGMLPVVPYESLGNTMGDTPLMMTTTASFETDDEGVLRTQSGLVLLGWAANADGSIPLAPRDTMGSLVPVVVNPNQTSADPTTAMTLGVNLPATDTEAGAAGDAWPVQVEYFSNLGTSEALQIDFIPDVSGTAGMNNRWTMEIRDSNTPDPITGEPTLVASYEVEFDDSSTGGGTIASITTLTGNPYDPVNGTITLGVGDNKQAIDLTIGTIGGANGLTQVGDKMQQSITKNGSPVGNLASLEIDENGYLKATYDTGFIRTLYQIPLVDVPNQNGLTALNNQTYQVSTESGSFFLWDAGDGPTGKVVGYAREASNVDVAAELTDLIQTQRAYSSNAKVIQTVDEMLQETTNIKR